MLSITKKIEYPPPSMDSLVDLICFHFKRRLNEDCVSTLLILKKLPDEMLIRIGAMPNERPCLMVYSVHGYFSVYLEIDNKSDGLPSREVVDVMLPLILYQPITFYAYVGEYRDDDTGILETCAHVSLRPFPNCKAHTFSKEDLERKNSWIHIN